MKAVYIVTKTCCPGKGCSLNLRLMYEGRKKGYQPIWDQFGEASRFNSLKKAMKAAEKAGLREGEEANILEIPTANYTWANGKWREA